MCPDPRAVPEYLLRSGESLNDSEGLCNVIMFVSSHSSPTLSRLRGLCAFMTLRAIPAIVGQISKGEARLKGLPSSFKVNRL